MSRQWRGDDFLDEVVPLADPPTAPAAVRHGAEVAVGVGPGGALAGHESQVGGGQRRRGEGRLGGGRRGGHQEGVAGVTSTSN